ncbi:hypothetical protein EYF80_058306 [Liparis tanakae]|uniref:Uncharacterized protein n=1 Tax=Liparis tanakae TaxID=230148 RepID=A0A4Z2ERY2_9TELE|nr:hypothetical protein EYF80_058306 [Liparis tanakae]
MSTWTRGRMASSTLLAEPGSISSTFFSTTILSTMVLNRAAWEYAPYAESLERARRSSFRKRPASIHVFIGWDTCCNAAGRRSDWEAVGTGSADTQTQWRMGA